jgi:hypothetical protein
LPTPRSPFLLVTGYRPLQCVHRQFGILLHPTLATVFATNDAGLAVFGHDRYPGLSAYQSASTRLKVQTTFAAIEARYPGHGPICGW